MLFWNDLEKYAERIAIVDENGVEYRYYQLLDTADKVARLIAARSLIFLVCENRFESIAAYVACLRRRAVPLLLNSTISKNAFLKLEETYHPFYICCPKNWLTERQILYSFGSYALFKTNQETLPSMCQELAVLLTTSGSTGSAKVVMLSADNIQANTWSIIDFLKIYDEDRAIITMPMNYTYGLSIIQSHLCAGARIITTPFSVLERGFWSQLSVAKATTFGGVPFFYEMLKKIRFSQMSLPSLRYITQAGGKLSQETTLEFIQSGIKNKIPFIVMYGQTEATARMSFLPWEYALEKIGSIGIPIPNGSFHIRDSRGQVVTEPDTEGELFYSGPNVALGYARSPDDFLKNRQFNGILRTGDIAKFDADGFFYVVGRKSRFLKIFGNRISLDEVENLLRKKGYDCACGGRDDSLVVYLVNAEHTEFQNVIDFLHRETSLHFSAFHVVSVPLIPRNEAGKPLYGRLEALYGGL